ncbi:hypothetical protein [Bradyrhizobium sp. CB2312]|uniref:hypothetical protein n=1 Tax=Bradyrhizobium sp. CB2312 TaxID=3039155 RepID=UPI0024B26A40|nr:hypothetical protein [Bradyrhizobium sp. CB2312]WFU71073.1 hypothetical protein QA642_38335 [Bradyrhizobium sp. CB2312]
MRIKYQAVAGDGCDGWFGARAGRGEEFGLFLIERVFGPADALEARDDGTEDGEASKRLQDSGADLRTHLDDLAQVLRRNGNKPAVFTFRAMDGSGTRIIRVIETTT